AAFTKYVAQNSWRSESSWAQYYVAILTDEKVRQDLTLTQLEMDNGKTRWQAVEQYKALEEKYSNFKDMDTVLYRHVKFLFDYGAIDEARPLVDKFLSRYPKSEYQEAFKFYKARIELRKGNPAEAYRLITTLTGKDIYVSQAAVSYYTAVSLAELCKTVKWQLDGQINMEKIAKLITTTVESDPSYKDNSVSLYDEACKTMAEGLYPVPDVDSLLQRRYTLQTIRRRTPYALLSKVLDDNITECREKTAQEYCRLGDIAYNAIKGMAPKNSAYKYYTSAITEKPDMEKSAYVYYRLGMSQISLRKFNEAINSLRKSVNLDPQATYADEAQFSIGFTLGTDMKRYIEAVSELRKVPVNYPSSNYAPEAMYHIGFYSQLIGDDKTAIWAYSNTARLYRGNIRAASAEEQVKLIIEDRTNRLRGRGFPEEEIKKDIALSLSREG
ncbi:MAG: tetratricopeptide repeat protein, partial [bacterium]|nr:tetratricopeptide repeat protein [bacterium]